MMAQMLAQVQFPAPGSVSSATSGTCMGKNQAFITSV